MAALPETAPAKPKQPRRLLVLARAEGFVHASIPLATRTIEALGQKTGAWTTVITYNAADITAENLRQYDAIFLASTTGVFLDDPADPAATSARRKALLEFVRGGKGLAGIHAATDSYHGQAGPPAAPLARFSRRRRKAALARLQQADRRVLQVPLGLPHANRRQDRGSRQPDQCAVHQRESALGCSPSPSVLDRRRGVHVQSGFLVADERARPHQRRLCKDAGGSKGAGAGAAPHGRRLCAQLHSPRRPGPGVRRSPRARRVHLQDDADAGAYPRGVQYALGDLQADDAPTTPATR